jgi:hypothetical protein
MWIKYACEMSVSKYSFKPRTTPSIPCVSLKLAVRADLIVGSPYDGPKGQGTVYIFNGSPQGLRSTASQVVQASDIGTNLSTFGYSLSAGTDLDKNGYAGACFDVTVTSYWISQ